MSKPIRILAVVILIIGAVWTQWHEVTPQKDSNTKTTGVVEKLFQEEKSDTVVEVSGVVEKMLRDDLEGSKHQKFILRLPESGHTVLISHNISLAKRVPISEGDEVELRGEYEWSDKGGVIHWTHHDPGGRRPGGWIKHKGKEYK